MEVKMLNYRTFLICLADQLDAEGRSDLADVIDKDWEEFLQLLEEGKLDFNFMFHGTRNPNDPYSNRGRETPLCAIPGPQ
jgi:hypothetical protein